MIPPGYCYATHAGKNPKCDNGCYEGCTCMQSRMRYLGHAQYKADRLRAYLESDYRDYSRRSACHRLWELNKDDSSFQDQEIMFRNVSRAEACGGDTARRTYLADGTVIRNKPRTHPQVYRSEGAKLGGIRTTLPSFEQFNCHLDCSPPVPCSTRLTKKVCIPPSVRQGLLCCQDMTRSIPATCSTGDTATGPHEKADMTAPEIEAAEKDRFLGKSVSLTASGTPTHRCFTPMNTMGCNCAHTGAFVESKPKYDAWRAKYLSRGLVADKSHQWFLGQQQQIINDLEREQNQQMDMWAREEACMTALKQMADEKHRRLQILEQDNVDKTLELQHDRDPDRTRVSKNIYSTKSSAFEVKPAATDLSSQPSKARFTEYREAARTIKTLLDNTKYNLGALSRT